MKIPQFAALYLLSAFGVFADSAGRPASPPDKTLKMVQAMESSKIGGLVSVVGDDGVSYHLRDFHFLGTVRRDGQIYSVAHALFVRSSNAETAMPPARGHNYIIVFDQNFKIAAHGKTEIGVFRMEENRILMNDVQVADLSTEEPARRHSGFIEINLPYPFADRISDADWESRSFERESPEYTKKQNKAEEPTPNPPSD